MILWLFGTKALLLGANNTSITLARIRHPSVYYQENMAVAAASAIKSAALNGAKMSRLNVAVMQKERLRKIED